MAKQRTKRPYAGSAPLTRRPAAQWAAAVLGGAMLLAPASRANALEILGQVGVLGEWELTAKLYENASDAGKGYSGPLVMRHVGICTQDGPEERAGQMRLQLGTSGMHVEATLAVDGLECRYSGRKSDAYEGMMTCPERAAVPMVLWLK
jgi:hypothetical protein